MVCTDMIPGTRDTYKERMRIKKHLKNLIKYKNGNERMLEIFMVTWCNAVLNYEKYKLSQSVSVKKKKGKTTQEYIP